MVQKQTGVGQKRRRSCIGISFAAGYEAFGEELAKRAQGTGPCNGGGKYHKVCGGEDP